MELLIEGPGFAIRFRLWSVGLAVILAYYCLTQIVWVIRESGLISGEELWILVKTILGLRSLCPPCSLPLGWLSSIQALFV